MTHLISPCECHSCFGPLAQIKLFPPYLQYVDKYVLCSGKETTGMILECALGQFVELPEDL